MKIGIDARLYGTENTGLGRYITKLIENLPVADKTNNYVIFVRKIHQLEISQKLGPRFKLVTSEVPIYSFREQIILPYFYYRENLDLLHVPHFNAPILYFRKKILTIHDLIKHASVGKETTTRNQFVYKLKFLGYLFLIKLITAQADLIIVPTKFVKNDISSRLKISPEKILVTYEASSGTIKKVHLTRSQSDQVLTKYGLELPFLVYTGNVYPHKNIDILVQAVKKHNITKEVDLKLAVICARSVFWERLSQKITENDLQNTVKLLGYLPDEEISKIYSLALALVHPSKMEGFGLTGIEAMGAGLPVISSQASCLPEIYGEASLYFDPDSLDDLVSKIEMVISDQSLRERLIASGSKQAKKYSWKKMVKETVAIYNQGKIK